MSYHQSKSLVTGVCQKCNKIFHRDGDLTAFSTSYSTPSYNLNVTLESVQNYRDWLMFAGNFCENCLPPMPEAVRRDIELENKRRQADMQQIYGKSERKTNNDNSNERPSIQRKGKLCKKIEKYIPNALHRSGGNSKRKTEE